MVGSVEDSASPRTWATTGNALQQREPLGTQRDRPLLLPRPSTTIYIHAIHAPHGALLGSCANARYCSLGKEKKGGSSLPHALAQPHQRHHGSTVSTSPAAHKGWLAADAFMGTGYTMCWIPRTAHVVPLRQFLQLQPKAGLVIRLVFTHMPHYMLHASAVFAQETLSAGFTPTVCYS